MSYSRWINSKFYTYWASKNEVYDKGSTEIVNIEKEYRGENYEPNTIESFD